MDGWELVRPLAEVRPFTNGSRLARLRWALRGYQRVAEALAEIRADVIFIFHSFSIFPTELRRILLELRQDVPIVGYTHGSHWDPSDLVRLTNYPDLELLDLANLVALDIILFDSMFIKDIVIDRVGLHNEKVAKLIERRARVVGLPLDLDLIDACKPPARARNHPTIVFNHAPVAAKDPIAFISVIERLMPIRDFQVLFTRAFDDGDPGAEELKALQRRFGNRIIVGGNLPITSYYESLWNSDIQVSTARHESLGISTLEAMYTENLCLLPDRCSYPEITAKNDDVLYRSLDDLEARIMDALSNPIHIQRVSKGLALRASQFGSEHVTPRIISAIDDALSSRGQYKGRDR